MIKTLRQALIGVIGVCFFCFPLALAHAGIGLPYGGLVVYAGYGECDCPVTITNIPLYFAAEPVYPPVLAELPLVYVPYVTTQIYSFYEIPVEGVYHVGQYIPGIPACWYYIPPYECGYIPTLGVITTVGTSAL